MTSAINITQHVSQAPVDLQSDRRLCRDQERELTSEIPLPHEIAQEAFKNGLPTRTMRDIEICGNIAKIYQATINSSHFKFTPTIINEILSDIEIFVSQGLLENEQKTRIYTILNRLSNISLPLDQRITDIIINICQPNPDPVDLIEQLPTGSQPSDPTSEPIGSQPIIGILKRSGEVNPQQPKKSLRFNDGEINERTKGS